MKRHCLATVVMVAASSPAWAHDADVVFARVEPLRDGGFYERLTLTAAALGLLAPVDANRDGLLSVSELLEGDASIRSGVWGDMVVRSEGQPCTLGPSRAALTPNVVELEAEFACPARAVEQTFRFLSVLPANFRVTVEDPSSRDGATLTAQGPMQTVMLQFPARHEERQAQERWRWGLRVALSLLIWAGLVVFGVRRAGRVPWNRLFWLATGGACLFGLGFWLVVSLST